MGHSAYVKCYTNKLTLKLTNKNKFCNCNFVIVIVISDYLFKKIKCISLLYHYLACFYISLFQFAQKKFFPIIISFEYFSLFSKYFYLIIFKTFFFNKNQNPFINGEF